MTKSNWEDAKKEFVTHMNSSDKKIPLPNKKYNIIYADPPWSYQPMMNSSASDHYSTMSLNEICNLPIKKIADENCILFIRGVGPIGFPGAAEVVNMQPPAKLLKKPDIFRDLILELVGDLPRIELFARNKTEGWDCWGNEV